MKEREGKAVRHSEIPLGMQCLRVCVCVCACVCAPVDHSVLVEVLEGEGDLSYAVPRCLLREPNSGVRGGAINNRK